MLKPNDIYILLAIHQRNELNWTYATMGESIGIAQPELHRALQRARGAHLFHAETRKVKRHALNEFIVHGLRYAFATTPGQVQRGYPTGWDGPGLHDLMTSDPLEKYIWSDPSGTHTGRSVTPLHRAESSFVIQNLSLHKTMAILDIIRLGGTRERQLATKLLEEKL